MSIIKKLVNLLHSANCKPRTFAFSLFKICGDPNKTYCFLSESSGKCFMVLQTIQNKKKHLKLTFVVSEARSQNAFQM